MRCVATQNLIAGCHPRSAGRGSTVRASRLTVWRPWRFESVKVLVVVDAELLDIEQPGALAGYLKGTGRVSEGEEPVVRVLARGPSPPTRAG